MVQTIAMVKPGSAIEDLLPRRDALEAEGADLQTGIAHLRADNAHLQGENAHLRAETLRGATAILPEFRGWAVHDGLAAYFQFPQAKHGACHAHTLRERKGLVENGSAWAGAMHAFLLDQYSQALPLPGEAAEEAQRRHRQLLSQAEQAEPPPIRSPGAGRPKLTPGRNLLRRLTAYAEAVLAFALVSGVPFTNHQAERDLRLP